MSRYGSTLFVNRGGARVSADKGALMVRAPDGLRRRVPMEAVDAVVLIGGSSITSDAIARCTARGVRVASLTRHGRVRFVAAPARDGNVHLRVAQVRAADDASVALGLARLIVAGKIANSMRLVRQWVSTNDRPERMAIEAALDGIRRARERIGSAPTGDHLRGVEGDAARWHFKALGAHVGVVGSAFALLRRSRRPPADPTNAALSFGYGVLTAELVGAADAVGLDPQVGFLHGVRSGRPSLALDILEEFRAPIVDRFVAGAIRRRQLRLEHFHESPGGGWYLTDEGRAEFLRLFEAYRQQEVYHDLLGRHVERWALPTLQMTILARHLRGDLPAYVPWQE